MKIVFAFVLFILQNPITSHHFEKFFEIEGGPEYMYYYTKFDVGTSNTPQSAIIDTGSDTLAFPCNGC